MTKPFFLEADDGELLRRIQQGDREAAVRLVDRLGPLVQRLVHRLTGWHSETQDVIQEVFVAMLRGAGGFRGEAEVSTWVGGIVVNCCRRFVHQRQRRPDTLPADVETAERPIGSDWELREHLTMAVGTLRQIDREVIILRYFEGIELTQMAAILDVTAHAVESRLVTFAEIDLRTDLPNDSPRSAFIFVIP